MDKQRLALLQKDYVQGFSAYCGIQVLRIGDGIFESILEIQPSHLQQDGFVHAGVIATMADHTAGYAAFTIAPPDHRILTIEFKINYFKPATGESIVCRSKVINRGKKIIVAESEIFSRYDHQEKLVSKATVTLMSLRLDRVKKKDTAE
ncbi:MAG: PaaI family thioesterase [Desulfobacteraceae bacterium]|nr:MAG: PaaI family thioesterase [Desulfobacteraceae bacterium]